MNSDRKRRDSECEIASKTQIMFVMVALQIGLAAVHNSYGTDTHDEQQVE